MGTLPSSYIQVPPPPRCVQLAGEEIFLAFDILVFLGDIFDISDRNFDISDIP